VRTCPKRNATAVFAVGNIVPVQSWVPTATGQRDAEALRAGGSRGTCLVSGSASRSDLQVELDGLVMTRLPLCRWEG
jgi:hypothetical protein